MLVSLSLLFGRPPRPATADDESPPPIAGNGVFRQNSNADWVNGLPPPVAGPGSNGAMEARFSMGLPPFTDDSPDPDPEPDLPIFPILGAQRTLDKLLAEEQLFRSLIKTGLPTGELQLPPVISPTLFERLASRVRDAEAEALREAGMCYVREARDVDELVAFAMRSLSLGKQAEADKRVAEAAAREVELDDYLDRAMRAARCASTALARVVTLLPAKASASPEVTSALTQQQESLSRFRR